MVGLPINSVVSPLLYDNKLRDFLLQKFQGIIIVIDDSIISVYIQQMWQKIKLNNVDENIELEVASVPTSATKPPKDDTKSAENANIKNLQATLK